MLYTIFNLNLDFVNNLPNANNSTLVLLYNNIESNNWITFCNDLTLNEMNTDLSNNINLLNALNSTDNLITFNNDPMSIYTFSVPNMKIFYPEPFIATGNFSHTDLWFIHISIYQYWLWFFFIFLIIFFY